MATQLHPLLDPDRRPVVGHRGVAAHAPENTMESFRQGIAAGAECLELDVRVSADGVPVVMHDPTLDRTTDLAGAVDTLTAAEISRADAGACFTRDGHTFPYRGRGIGVPTLEEVLGELTDVPLLIEVKTAAAGPAARRVIERYRAEQRCIVESYHGEATEPFRGSAIAVGASGADVRRLLHRALARWPVQSLPYSFMSIPRWFRGIRLPIASLVAVTRPAGCVIHVWTVNEPRVAHRLWAVGVHGIVSDDPARILAARAAG